MFVAAKLEAAAKRTAIRKGQESHQQAAEKAASEVALTAVSSINTHVLKVYELQQQIELEQAALKKEFDRYQTAITKLSTQIRTIQDALKQLGNFEHYISVIEQEVEAITAAVVELAVSKRRQDSKDQSST